MTYSQSLASDRSCALSHRLRLRKPVASADEVAAERDSDVIGSLMWPSIGLDINRIDSLTTVLGLRGAPPRSGYPSTIAWSVSIANRRQEALDTTRRVRDALMYPGRFRDRPTPNESDWPTASTGCKLRLRATDPLAA